MLAGGSKRALGPEGRPAANRPFQAMRGLPCRLSVLLGLEKHISAILDQWHPQLLHLACAQYSCIVCKGRIEIYMPADVSTTSIAYNEGLCSNHILNNQL